ncbi:MULTISPECIES: GntR family transcriptional regulator [Rhizobium]|uniref:GntR family transcriptional regulator n=1 Tax=Rhizobium TaxID=379 RepID=UPI0007E97F1A|nr:MULTISPECIES: GntR family transcriptional regulator [Rhizobium]ANK95000.1 GntR family transcriptional regulator protein [Rhizobium sp. N6212]ANL01052.1 GntR family transcriptional regulator protein [Rhizobium sp. N621]ANL07175.1 GntR family transcriptional regulator protein [Rhizobium esperanzae]ANL13344.1 GntR family transcriptional regulator protein [Rhizobium sp. N1341]ANL25328.1 GntR family transcriptional regulator protein [Rhizobium sp. N113]
MRQSSEAQAPAVSIFQEVGPRLRRVTTAGAIYERLYADIVSLRMPPGLLLQEKRIAEDFGVSRTPVREALLRLSEGGLVDIYPQSGTVVSRVPVASIPEAVVVRKALEGTTVEAAAETASAADIAHLDAIISRQRSLAALGNASNFHEEDEAFHEAIAEIAGYPGIWALLKTVKVQIDRARRLALPALGRMDNVVREHIVIRNALAAHDAAAARGAMIHHLSAVIPDVDELRSRYPDYFC